MSNYQGWANYETWAVHLWVSNDDGLARECEDRTRAIARRHDGDRARWSLADDLKEWIGDMAPDLGGTLWADLLGAALSEVDWNEIAIALLADFEDDGGAE